MLSDKIANYFRVFALDVGYYVYRTKIFVFHQFSLLIIYS